MNEAKKSRLTESQAAALELIRRNGRFGVGEFGGVRRPTAYALRDAGLIRIEHERRRDRVFEVAYPV